MNEHDSVMRRLSKLLAIACDGRGDANEAAAAASMAESIKRKYQIENLDVIEADLRRQTEFASTDIGATLDPEGTSRGVPGWAGILAVAVARLHDCQARVVRTSRYGATLRFSGYRPDAEVARFTYMYLVGQLNLALKAYRQSRWRTRSDLGAFRRGFVTAICRALERATSERPTTAEHSAESRALTLLKDHAVAGHFGPVRYGSTSYRTSAPRAHADGVAAGQGVNVRRRAVTDSTGCPRLGR